MCHPCIFKIHLATLQRNLATSCEVCNAKIESSYEWEWFPLYDRYDYIDMTWFLLLKIHPINMLFFNVCALSGRGLFYGGELTVGATNE